ncbi:MAG: hypothetical protein AAFQ42_10225 [Pseudomonadota bacterium]
MQRFLTASVAAALLAFGTTGALAAPGSSGATSVASSVDAQDGMVTRAQFSIQLGGSETRIRRILRERGYTDIVITKRSFTRTTAEACRDGVRYELRLSNSGADRGTGRIGTCKQVITLEQAEQKLRDEGYKRINVTEQGDVPFIAIACRDGERIRLRINKFGETTGQRDLGRCRQALSPDDVRAKLREDGYNRIRFTDRQLPRYVAEACLRNRKFELVLSNRGRIRDRKRIGRCDPPLTAASLPANLADRGFDRIEVVNGKPPRFLVEACRDLRRVELTVGRYGRILQEYNVGKCPPPLTRADLLTVLNKNGYRKVKFNTIPGSDYQTESCRERKKLLTRWSQYGEILDEKEQGRCVSPRLEQIVDRYDDRGLENLTMFIEGCRRGRKIRVEIDPSSGDRISRERVGRC